MMCFAIPLSPLKRCFIFTSDWLTKWHKLGKPTAEWHKTNAIRFLLKQ